MPRALLMAHEDVADLLGVHQRVVQGQDRAPGNAEDIRDALEEYADGCREENADGCREENAAAKEADAAEKESVKAEKEAVKAEKAAAKPAKSKNKGKKVADDANGEGDIAE